MNAEEQEGIGKVGFFSKIKRGIAGMSLEVGPGEVEFKKIEEATVTLSAPLDSSAPVSPSVDANARPSSQEANSEEAEEMVITCEGAAGPQVRRSRGHGPTITHATSCKAQSQWLFAEVEAKAVDEPQVSSTVEDQTVAPVEVQPTVETTVQDVAETSSEPPVPPSEAAPIIAPETDIPNPTGSTSEPRKLAMANNLKESLNELMQIDGAVAVALVDGNSGMAMGTAGGGPLNLEVAAAGNSEVVRSKLKVMKALNLRENIEDILITLGSQYHLIRPLAQAPEVFVYLVLNKANSNLAMARFKLASVERELAI